MEHLIPEENKAITFYVRTIPTLDFSYWCPNHVDFTQTSCDQLASSLECISSQSDRLHSSSNENTSADSNIDHFTEYKQNDGSNTHSFTRSNTVDSEMTHNWGCVQPQLLGNELPSPVDIVIGDCCNDHEGYESKEDFTKQHLNSIEDQLNNNVSKSQHWKKEESEPIEEAKQPTDILYISTGNREVTATETLSPNDLDKLKVIAKRLNLQTRRGSYNTWRSKLNSSLGMCTEKSSTEENELKPPITDEERMQQKISSNQSDDQKLCNHPKMGKSARHRIGETLSLIRADLMEIRRQDQSLARQFISIRNEIQQLRLQNSKQAFDDMVDDAQWTIAENEQFENVCDEPRTLDKSPLLTLGITKMNLTERRFSVF